MTLPLNPDETGAPVFAYVQPEDDDDLDVSSVVPTLQGLADDLARVHRGAVTPTAGFDPDDTSRLFYDWRAKPDQFASDSAGRFIQLLTGANKAFCTMKLPHNSVLGKVTVWLNPDNAHAGVPASPPKLRIYKRVVNSEKRTQIGSTGNPAAAVLLNVSNYEAIWLLEVTGLSETINAESTLYEAEVEGESSTNAQPNCHLMGVIANFAVGTRDVGAA